QTFEEWNRETGSTKLPERVGSGRENSQENQEIAGTAENKPLIAAAIVSNGRAERRNPTRPMGFNVACVWSDRHDRQRRRGDRRHAPSLCLDGLTRSSLRPIQRPNSRRSLQRL